MHSSAKRLMQALNPVAKDGGCSGSWILTGIRPGTELSGRDGKGEQSSYRLADALEVVGIAIAAAPAVLREDIQQAMDAWVCDSGSHRHFQRLHMLLSSGAIPPPSAPRLPRPAHPSLTKVLPMRQSRPKTGVR
jgi:hypothetical protein